ncbi:hypothetical protein AWC38_SpisGene10165 [Stylophora pistillata]|uniref:Uncharacterized protein n=1 Tax=Stylophora pistillata TaxID=50429 RepID=A0A2B4S8V6_STYPI|nr:hypothetical protein AWC38_SpisGene10165 [Stylophora pistillata]
MPSASSCRCDARAYLHAHCYCSVYNCNGKAVSRSTYHDHRKASQESDIANGNDLRATAAAGGETPGTAECYSNHGWTYKNIELFNKLAWRHNILVEETFGLEACVITEHNLIHVADDIYRFSSPDNYWVFDLERAVKRYVNQSTNHRNIEKTYSDNETRREVLQNLDISRKGKSTPVLTLKEIDSGIKLKQVPSLDKGNHLIVHVHDNLIDVQDGILIGRKNKEFQVISESQRQEIFQDISNRGAEIEYYTFPSVTKRCKSLLKPGKEPGVPHVLYRKGENAMLWVNNEERTGRISDIHSVIIQNGDITETVHLFVEVQLYQHVTDDNGHPKYHPGSQSQYLCLSQTIQMVNSIDVFRKVILYVDRSLPHQVVLIDFDMPSLPSQKEFVVVPFYPKKHDMVLILGENDVQWIAKIITVQEGDKMVGLHFLKEHPRWPGGKKFIKESSTIHSVHWDCIVKDLQGTWMPNGMWELKETL